MPPAPRANEPPPAPSRLEWTSAALLAVNLAWTVWCLGGYRPESRLVSAWLTAAAVVVLLLDRLIRARAPRWHPGGCWLLPFAGLVVANVLVITPVRWLGWLDAWGWLQLAATLWLAFNLLGFAGPRRLLVGSLAVLVTLQLAAALYQRLVDPAWLPLEGTQSTAFLGRSSGTFGIPNSLAGLLLLVLPPAMWRAARGPGRLPGGAVALAGGLAMVLTVSRGAWFAFALALALWPLLDPGRAWRRRLALSGGMLAGAVLAFVALYAVSAGARDRLTALVRDGGERTRPAMWAGAWRLFLDAPVLGTGAGSYNVLFERHRPAGYRDEPQWAHNEFLNTLGDHGAAGFALAFALPAVALWRARRTRTARPVATGEERAWGVGLLGFGLTLGLDFHLKIPGLAMAAALAMALWCGRWTGGGPVRPCRSASLVRRLSALAAGAGVVAAMAFLVTPTLRAEASRYGARRAIDAWAEGRVAAGAVSARLAAARARFAQAVGIDAANAQAWADLSYVLSLLAREEPGATQRLGVEAEAAARQALARASVVPEFWWRLGVALDMQGRWTEAGAAFARAVELAPHHPLGWYYQAYHYSLNPVTRALVRPSLATCLRLDPGYPPAESLRESLKTGP